MKLEAGKWYSDRAGSRWHIDYAGSVYSCGHSELGSVSTWRTINGRALRIEDSPLDLISEWTDAPKVGSPEWANSLPEGTKITHRDGAGCYKWLQRRGGVWFDDKGLNCGKLIRVCGWELYQEPPAVGSSAWANSLPVGTKVRWYDWSSGNYVERMSCGWRKTHELLRDPADMGAQNDGWLLYTEPKLRPWKPDEVPVGCALRRKRPTNCRGILYLFDGINAHSNVFSGALPLETLLSFYEHSTDGGVTWLPCGVLDTP